MDIKNLNKTTLGLIAAVLLIAIWAVTTYNGLVSKDEAVNKAFANVQTDYQRRMDLIPNLVEVVKGYAKHERETLTEVVEARSHATQVTISAENLSEEALRQYQSAQGDLSAALGRLMAIAEAYPDLKANENFLRLQAQLEGTENRIKESRTLYNESVQDFNTSVRRFPTNLVANIFGDFKPKAPFQAEEGASKAPSLQGAFDN